MYQRIFIHLFLLGTLLAGCSALLASQPGVLEPQGIPTSAHTAKPDVTIATLTPTEPVIIPLTGARVSGSTRTPAFTETPVITSTSTQLPPERWQEWPVLPQVSAPARQIYQAGLLNGTDPNAFSIFGDCQSKPEEFLGVYGTGEYTLTIEDRQLLETIDYFSGSFNRKSPTVKDGTTVGALLWDGWIDPQIKYCDYGESPIDCELRVNNPSIVLINLGTHWENRNNKYLLQIVETVLANGAVPVLATKADNREGNNRLNLDMARAAEQYDIPLWNFWRAAQVLPNRGLVNDRKDIFNNVYLTEEGLELHRISGLRMFDSVRRQLNEAE